MIALDPTLVLVLSACLYILASGGLALVRREGLSLQFAIESAAVAAMLIGGSWLLGLRLSPVVLLIGLYLVTMRCRLTVDLANLLATWRRYGPAFRLYRLALAWWPDAPSLGIVLTNRGVAELHAGQVDDAIHTFESLLVPGGQSPLSRLGTKYEAACRYNLGLAYEQKGEEARALQEYYQVADLLPGSVYAHAAESAIRRRRTKGPL